MHLAIDGYAGDTAKMWDAQLVRDFLLKCPDELGMTRITEPEVLEYNAPKAEDSGYFGIRHHRRESHQHTYIPSAGIRKHRHIVLPSLR